MGKKISAPSVGLLCLLLQVTGGLAEWVQCRPGFTEDRYTFSVPGTLEPGTVLGKVSFDRCTEQKTTHYVSEDPGFEVQVDGIVLAKHQIKLHGSKRNFIVHTRADADWTFFTVVALQSKKHHHKKQESSPEEHAGLLPKSMSGRKRQKRDWVIPPNSLSENEKGPFPKNMVQIKSNKDKEIRLFYSITGQGADTPPVGVFIIERETGWMKVTRTLDREDIAQYSLSCHAVSANGQSAEDPMEIVIKVIDQNDNHPQFTEKVFHGSVAEGSRPGTSVMTVTATDADDSVDTDNGVIGYSIISQDPQVPSDQMFTINNQTGMISMITTGLDRETTPQYTVYIKAADQMGAGLVTTGTAVITVTDMNDNPPIFDPKTYTANVPENEAGVEVSRLIVTDADVANTDAWHAVYNIVKGNEANLFGVTTVNNNIGLLKTIKPLDFEVKKEYILYVAVTNTVNFSVPLPTSTATITVTVLDVNEAPVFQPPTKTVDISEDLPNGQEVASYTAQDPDKAQNQKILYSIGFDPAGWLSVDKDNGIITGKGNLDRESQFVQNGNYKAIILAVDNGSPLATGTGTLLIHFIGVSDNTLCWLLKRLHVKFNQRSPLCLICVCVCARGG
ncbi:cadherin-1-like [Ascaphus truei]|uniref:cadherin-1-like n=1 Tax=Ascaphus truei TaxID=8439 RepID=UPI003F599D8B